MNTKKTIIKIVIGTIVLISLMVGIFLLGKNSEKKEVSQVKTEQKNELVKQLQEVKNQLQKETNLIKKQELEERIKNLERQIQNLGGSNNPSNPSPQNPLPNKTYRQLTVKCNGAREGKCEYININNHQERILIDTKNQIFYSEDALYMKDSQYNLTFYEEDAEKKSGSFVFEENNDKFQLTPIVPSPPPQQPSPLPNNNPNPNQAGIEVKWGGGSGRKNYWLFTSADWPKTRKKIFISKKHPLVKGKKFAHQITPNLKITFQEKDVSQKIDNDEWLFDENNNKFTLTPLANWPDDPNYQNEIEEEGGKTIKKVKLVNQGFGGDFIFNNMTEEVMDANQLQFYRVSKNHPTIKNLLQNQKLQSEKIFNISYETADGLEGGVIVFNEFNQELEITET